MQRMWYKGEPYKGRVVKTISGEVRLEFPNGEIVFMDEETYKNNFQVDDKQAGVGTGFRK